MDNYSIENKKLDDYQMRLLKSNCNSIVIAGAGSGKTLTILAKVYYLIENKICNPDEILIISFTNASVNDLIARSKYKIDIFTFHKLALNILKNNNYNFTYCSSTLLSFIIKELLENATKEEIKDLKKYFNINQNYDIFIKTSKFYSVCNFIETFINLYKTNNIKYNEFSKILFSKKEKNILKIIFNIYYNYEEEKRSIKSIDFDDMIIMATQIIPNNYKYKYIIIDEFQDTSLIRLNLIKEIIKKTNSKIIVVGDDFQSIYHFSGCDLNIFLNFKNIFENVNTIILKNTYRNSIELIKIASKFITKNPLQIKKNLNSNKSVKNPIILVPYKNKKEILENVLNTLIHKTNDIMILSRNNNDIFDYINEKYIIDKNTLYYNNIKLKYYTVHKSKGLEAEYTIILNCNNDILGFPNKIENCSLINKILPKENYKYAEERRLFYVALTRCKKKTFIIYDKYNPSIFIKEIKKIIKSEIHKISYF